MASCHSHTHTHPCVKAPRDLSPRRSSPDRVHVSPLTCRSSFNCCSLRIRLELRRQENPCQLFFQHQIGTLITFLQWTPITGCHLNHLYFFKIEKVPGGRERKTRCSKQLFCTLFCLSPIHDVWRHTLAVQNGRSPLVQYKILPCLLHWQQCCHIQTREKSIRLSSVSQVLPAHQTAELIPNDFLFEGSLFWSDLDAIFTHTCEHISLFFRKKEFVRYHWVGIEKSNPSSICFIHWRQTHRCRHTSVHFPSFPVQ